MNLIDILMACFIFYCTIMFSWLIIAMMVWSHQQSKEDKKLSDRAKKLGFGD